MIIVLINYAFAETGITLGLNAIDGYDSGSNSYEYVYYGTFEGQPIKWRVLDTTSNDGTTPAVFMLSEYTLGNRVFRSDYTASDANQWSASDIKEYLQGEFTENSFEIAEKEAIIATTKTNDTDATDYDRYTLGATNLDNEKLFLLSGSEVVNTKYGFSSQSGDDENRKARSVSAPLGSAMWWRLRSPSSRITYSAGVVNIDGWVYGPGVADNYGLRPALNLNLSSVLFTSSAVEKSTSDIGIFKLSEDTVSEHKITLLETTRSFSVDNKNIIAGSGENVAINYTGATVGSNEYISLIILKEDLPIYYGRVLKPITESGTVTITIPSDIPEGEYTIKIFSEQYNGDYKTDYASQFQDISLHVCSSSITYNTVYGIAPEILKVETGSRVILPEIKAEGKKFLGWYKSDNTEFTNGSKVNGNITLTAKWGEDIAVNENILDTSGANVPELYQGLKPIKMER